MKTRNNSPQKLLIIHNQQFFSLPAWLPKRPILGRNMNFIGSPCLLSTISLSYIQNYKNIDLPRPYIKSDLVISKVALSYQKRPPYCPAVYDMGLFTTRPDQFFRDKSTHACLHVNITA